MRKLKLIRWVSQGYLCQLVADVCLIPVLRFLKGNDPSTTERHVQKKSLLFPLKSWQNDKYIFVLPQSYVPVYHSSSYSKCRWF